MMREKKLFITWLTVIVALFLGAAISRAAVENGSATQVSGATDVVAGLVTQGLRAATSNPPINIGTGQITAGNVVATDTTNVRIGGTTMASDVVPGYEYLQSQSAYAQAATNTTGANLALGAGQGSTFFTVLIAANLSGKTFTTVVATATGSTTTVKTDGTDFTHSGTNSTEATNLAGALNGISGISATAVGAVVYVTLSAGTLDADISTNSTVTDATATNGTDGNVVMSANALVMPDDNNFLIGGNSSSNGSGAGGMFLGPQNGGLGVGAPGGLAICPGLDQKSFTIVTFASIVGNTFTVTYNYVTPAGSGTAYNGGFTLTLTAVASGASGLQFNAVTSNNQTATNLAAAINANISSLILQAVASGASVIVKPQPGVFKCTPSTNASGANATVSLGVDATIFIGGGDNSASGMNFGGNSVNKLNNITADASSSSLLKVMGISQPLFSGAMQITTSAPSNVPNALNIFTASTGSSNNSTGGDITVTPGTGNASGTGRAGDINLTGATNVNNAAGTTIRATAGTCPTGGSDVIFTGGAGGSTSGDAGTFQGLGGNGGAGGSAGGQSRLKGGNATVASTNGHAGGIAMSIGAPTGTGTAANDKCNLQAGFTEASGTTTQTLGDRLTILGHNITMSTTTATATTILVLNVPTSGTSGGVIIQYFLQNTGSAIVPGTATGMFCVSCSNNAGTVTATAGALTGQAANVGAFTAFTAGTISTTISTTAVSIKIAPSWSAGTSTGHVCTVNAFAFGKGVTITAQ